MFVSPTRKNEYLSFPSVSASTGNCSAKKTHLNLNINKPPFSTAYLLDENIAAYEDEDSD
jgi:hypothetical protein